MTKTMTSDANFKPGTNARVILDSINPMGHRLLTIEATFHRFVLAEFNTHRVFSRNSASSRAIPVGKQLERVRTNTAYPVTWPAEQRGMQGGEELDDGIVGEVMGLWEEARDNAVSSAERLHKLGVHKSVTNRLLEPFMWHTVIVTSTEWDNFFHQRCSPLAQPEIRVAAEMMRDAIDASTPQELFFEEWHLPYIDDEDREWAAYRNPERELGKSTYPTLCRISAARCARVSYLTHDGKRDRQADLDLYERLTSADPMHASPLEHVATPDDGIPYGNFTGWRQLRHDIQFGRAS